MQSLGKYNERNKYLLCAIYLFSKNAWVVPLKDKKGVSIVNAFQKIISEGRKPNKAWVDQGREFYNNSFKDFLKINNIERYSTFNKYVTSDSYAECNEDWNKKTPKFKIGDHVRNSKYGNIFAKGYAPNCLKDVFVVSRIKNTVAWIYMISDLNSELQKSSQENFRIEKVLKRKGEKLYVK